MGTWAHWCTGGDSASGWLCARHETAHAVHLRTTPPAPSYSTSTIASYSTNTSTTSMLPVDCATATIASAARTSLQHSARVPQTCHRVRMPKVRLMPAMHALVQWVRVRTRLNRPAVALALGTLPVRVPPRLCTLKSTTAHGLLAVSVPATPSNHTRIVGVNTARVHRLVVTTFLAIRYFLLLAATSPLAVWGATTVATKQQAAARINDRMAHQHCDAECFNMLC